MNYFTEPDFELSKSQAVRLAEALIIDKAKNNELIRAELIKYSMEKPEYKFDHPENRASKLLELIMFVMNTEEYERRYLKAKELETRRLQRKINNQSRLITMLKKRIGKQ